MFGNPVNTTDKIVAGVGAGFTIASEAGIILKEVKYIQIGSRKLATTTYSAGSIVIPKNETTDEKKKKIRLRFIIIFFSISMLSAMFTASMIYFFPMLRIFHLIIGTISRIIFGFFS